MDGRPLPSEAYPSGCQHEWCALDASDHLGVFNTAGCGPLPEAALDEGMANRVLDLLRGKTPDRSAEGVYGIDFDVEFFDYARCGFFPFAWSDWGQPYTRTHAYYKLQAMPVQPLKINDLSLGTDLLNWLSEFRFAVTFRPDWRIDVQELARAAKGRLVGSLRPN